MKNVKTYLLIIYLGLISASIFAPVIHVNPTPTGTLSAPIAIPDAPAPRNISAFFDNGGENPYDSLFGSEIHNPTSMPITTGFLLALQSDTPTPTFASESIMNNLIARQIIVQDFLTLSDDQLTQKYGSIDKFQSKETRDLFKKICKTITKIIDDLKNNVNSFAENPTLATFNTIYRATIAANSDISDFYYDAATEAIVGSNDLSAGSNFVLDIYKNYVPFNNALDLTKWSIGKTTDGSYLLLPKDSTGSLEPNGFNYKNIDGFNGTPIANPFDSFNANFKQALANPNTDTKAAIRSVLDITKIPQETPASDPSVITFTPEKYAKSNEFFMGHGSPKTTDDPGLIVNIDTDFFNATVLPALEKNYIQTLTYESCYGADINAEAAFNSPDPHSFTIISGNSTLSVISTKGNLYVGKVEALMADENKIYDSTGKFSTPEEIKQKARHIFNKFNGFYDSIQTSTAKGASDFFHGARLQESITGITGLPSIKLATTDKWMTANDVRDNLLQIFTVKDRVNVVNDTPFSYRLGAGGGILASSETILTPVTIESGAELPFIVPLSVGQKTHYIKEIEVKEASITTDLFINKSIKPFFDQVNYHNDSQLADKTIVIDSLGTKDGVATVLVNRFFAMYTLNNDVANPVTGEKPVHTILLSEGAEDFLEQSNVWEQLKYFEEKVQVGRDQATQSYIEIAKVQNISTTIQSRQEALNVIGRLRGIVNVNLGINDQLTIWNAVQEAIANNNNQPLSKEFLSTFSLQELQTFCNVVGTRVTSLAPTDPAMDALSQTLQTAHQQIDYKNLLQTLSTKMNINNEAVLDWFITLTLDEQKLMQNDFNALLEETVLAKLDLSILSAKEQLVVENYIQATLNIITDPTQITDLQAKLQTVAAPRDPVKFNQHLKDKLNTLSTLTNKSAIIDWVTSLQDEEKANIALDITAFFVQNLANDPYLQTYKLSTLNVTELFELKINLEKFSLSSSADQNTILEKASTRNGSPITLESITTILTNGLPLIDQSIQKVFNAIQKEQQLRLIDSRSADTYAKIFKKLPFEMQTTIAQNLDLLKNALATDLLTYQKSLLPERIAAAATTADLIALKNDMVAAGMIANKNDTPADFNARLKLLETQQNQQIADHTPAIPNAGSTGTLKFDPTIINEQTGQPLAPNANPENPNIINTNSTAGQLIPDVNPNYENKDLEAEYEKEKAQEDAQKEQAKEEEAANEEARQEGRTERVIE